MAAKHDGKHARANMWVTHQNLARAKGGRPLYQFKERKIPTVPKAAPVTAPRPIGSEPKPADATSAIHALVPLAAEATD